ncbi:MAG TPA: hypothetical protein VFY46_02450, partial [Acidimicrobiia bacterium]|nr:hypothetical protein [Acidimicrobiia bacterium]
VSIGGGLDRAERVMAELCIKAIRIVGGEGDRFALGGQNKPVGGQTFKQALARPPGEEGAASAPHDEPRPFEFE